MVPCGDGVIVVLTSPEGEVTLQQLSWAEFERLREALEREG